MQLFLETPSLGRSLVKVILSHVGAYCATVVLLSVQWLRPTGHYGSINKHTVLEQVHRHNP